MKKILALTAIVLAGCTAAQAVTTCPELQLGLKVLKPSNICSDAKAVDGDSLSTLFLCKSTNRAFALFNADSTVEAIFVVRDQLNNE